MTRRELETQSVEDVRTMAAKLTGKRAKPKPEAPRYLAATEPVTLRLPYPPLLNHYYRTAVVASHSQTYLSARGKQYREIVGVEWSRQVRRRYEGRLALRIEVWWPDRRVGDVDGVAKSVMDSLEHAGAYENDRQVKLLIIEEGGIEKPGWITITLGHRPGDAQGTLFETEW